MFHTRKGRLINFTIHFVKRRGSYCLRFERKTDGVNHSKQRAVYPSDHEKTKTAIKHLVLELKGRYSLDAAYIKRVEQDIFNLFLNYVNK